MRSQVFRLLGVCAVVCSATGAFVACSSEPNGEPVSNVITDPATETPAGNRVGRFVGYFDKDTHQFQIERNVLGDDIAITSSDLLTQNQYVLADGGGVPTPNSVDLKTLSVSDPYPNQKSFSATVDLRSFYDQSLANVYVYIDTVTLPDGGPTTAYSATNGVGAKNALGLLKAAGTWNYNNGSTNSPNLQTTGKNGGFLSANPTLSTDDGLWSATQLWTFNNPGDENIIYDIKVYASLGYSKYALSQSGSQLAWVEACPAPYSTGSGSAWGAIKASSVSLPFDFTLWNTNTTTVDIGAFGSIAPGGYGVEETGTSAKLPDTDAPEPVLFAFWDKLTTSTNDKAQICTTSVGTAPNRQFIVEWHNFDFNAKGTGDGPNLGASLTFEAVLFEGTNEVDVTYLNMVGADGGTAGRETGSKATVGTQDETAANAKQLHNNTDGDFASGTTWYFVPSP